MSKSPLEKVLEHAGSDLTLTDQRTVIATACGVTRQAVEHWEKDGVPGRHVLALETLSGGAVTARELLEWSDMKRKEKAAA